MRIESKCSSVQHTEIMHFLPIFEELIRWNDQLGPNPSPHFHLFKSFSTQGMSRFTLSLRNLQRPAGNSATVSSSRTRSRLWRGGKAQTGTGAKGGSEISVGGDTLK